MKALRSFLVAGLLIWVPVIITIFVVRFLINVSDRALLLIPLKYRPETLLGFNIPGLGVIFAFLVLLVTGLLARNYFGTFIVAGWEKLMSRIPVVRTVYHGARQIAETVFADNSSAFSKVCLIEYPRRGAWSLCFQTSTEVGEVQGRTNRKVVSVFVPTTPNPTSGFVIILPVEDVIELDMSVDEGLRMIISLGVVVPKWKNPADFLAKQDEEQE
ncbi:MAG: DUF502 domain-containing protein [Gammaproteobacteria bacterium]|nr:DUF502 domain-containing protein [Gammaproteobacteria bacterium]NNC97551.1 DUF502 domain-containing protein [Gammaproteobacteria bacterium]NNM12822.1 DUF502 domain-containing protein [Gammaproteobacteria bacterium]